jgi:hypothetical protein
MDVLARQQIGSGHQAIILSAKTFLNTVARISSRGKDIFPRAFEPKTSDAANRRTPESHPDYASIIPAFAVKQSRKRE